MLPKSNDGLTPAFEITGPPTRTHKLHYTDDRIFGYTDGLDAMRQAVYLILNIERYEYLIYSWNYGVELRELFGTQITYAIPEAKRRITEALMQDDRVTAVDSFEFETSRNKVFTRFTVHTTVGDVDAQAEIAI